MRYFKPYYYILILLGNHCSQLGVHIVDILFVCATTHTFPYDVQKGKYPGL